MRTHVRMIRSLGRLVGLDADRLGERGFLVRRNGFEWSSHRQAFEQVQADEELRLVIARLEIDTIVDVGANMGQFANRVRSLGFAGQIISFEPNPAQFAKLQAAATADSRWSVLPFAVGATPGEATLNITRTSEFASMLTSNDSVSMFRNDLEIMQAVKVPMVSLDSIWSEHVSRHGARSIFLKVDTQGYDHHVFEGGNHALKQVRALLFEVPFVPLYDGMVSYMTTLELLHARGFGAAGLWPVSRAADSLTFIEADLLMLNRSIGEVTQ